MLPGSELTEAILNASGSAALVQKVIDPQILELQRRYAPLLAAIPRTRWDSTVYNFNTRTQIPVAGFVTDGGARPVTTSTYVQNPFTIKNLQGVGGVTGYAEAVTTSFGSLRGREIMGMQKAMSWAVELGILYGSAGSTIAGPYPQFDGLDAQVNDSTSTTPNTFPQAGANFALSMLDQLILAVESNAAAYPNNDYFFLISPTIDKDVAQLLTNQQRFISNVGAGLHDSNVDVASGLNVPSYRDIPFVKSSFMDPRTQKMGTVSTTPASTGGSLAAATYYYKVDAIIAQWGAILASPEVSAVTTGSTSTVTLGFTPPTVTAMQQNLPPVLYRVYRSTATGTETLLGYVDANVGVLADGVTPLVTTSIVDTGATLVAQNGATTQTNYPAAYVGTNAGITPKITGGQDIYLISRDPDTVIRPYVREMQPIDLYPTTASPDALPFAYVDDTVLAVRSPYFLARATDVTA